jgi:hypothetical protein
MWRNHNPSPGCPPTSGCILPSSLSVCDDVEMKSDEKNTDATIDDTKTVTCIADDKSADTHHSDYSKVVENIAEKKTDAAHCTKKRTIADDKIRTDRSVSKKQKTAEMIDKCVITYSKIVSSRLPSSYNSFKLTQQH